MPTPGMDGAAQPTRSCAAAGSSPGAPSPTTCGRCPRSAGAQADDFYRDRWSHDKVVRSTHGVNCTGLLLVEGLRQGRDHHLGDPADRLPLGRARTRPEYEPRGCPRGAAFSWYTYSPTRVRYPYVRGVLLQMFREAKAQHDGDPVRAWAHIVENPLRAKALQVRPRQGRPGPRHLGRGQPRSSPPPTSTRSRSTAPTGSPASRRSRRCRWSRTPPAPGS